MRISTRHIAFAAALVLAGCANDQQTITESSAATTPSVPAADDSQPATDQPTPDLVAINVVARAQELMYANNDEVQALISIDTTNQGNRQLNEIVQQQLAPLRTALAQAPPADTWYLVRPLSSTITEQTNTTATVSVWSVELFSRNGFVDPETWWWITDIQLVNQNGEWLVDSYSQRPGPVAAPGEDHWPATAHDLDDQLEGHRQLPAITTS